MPFPQRMENHHIADLPPDPIIFGKSAVMRNLENKVRRILGTNLPILLQGESGTGKKILSQFIHNHSGNSTGPYLSVNCASSSSTLLEFLTSTLVGADDPPNSGEQGAPSSLSAIGTLFLDEVGELSATSQLQLLHSLLERDDCGREEPLHPLAGARMIGATTSNLRLKISDNKFRRDLFYRLAVVTLEIPPLRNRREDLLIIANYLRQNYSKSFSMPERPFSDTLLESMHRYPWPGNIRELENFVCRYMVLGPEENLVRELEGGGSSATNAPIPGDTLLRDVTKRTLANVEREMIVKALEQHHGSLKHAARTLGISYRTLMNKMDQAGLPRTRHTTRSRNVLDS